MAGPTTEVFMATKAERLRSEQERTHAAGRQKLHVSKRKAQKGRLEPRQGARGFEGYARARGHRARHAAVAQVDARELEPSEGGLGAQRDRGDEEGIADESRAQVARESRESARRPAAANTMRIRPRQRCSRAARFRPRLRRTARVRQLSVDRKRHRARRSGESIARPPPPSARTRNPRTRIA